jgi:hypothetical protein
LELYLREISTGEQETLDTQQMDDKVLERFHKEMEYGVEAFIKNLPENVKGMKQE